MLYKYKYNLKLTKKANEVFGGIVKGAYIALDDFVLDDEELMMFQDEKNIRTILSIEKQQHNKTFLLLDGQKIALHLFNDSVVVVNVNDFLSIKSAELDKFNSSICD